MGEPVDGETNGSFSSELFSPGSWEQRGIDLKGGVIFHTAVSPAGVGPTSSNKLEIESSFETLSKLGGIKMHLGKGAIKPETVKMLAENNAVFAIIPPEEIRGRFFDPFLIKGLKYPVRNKSH